eukprot:TRINITY_DN1506_c0_g1_i1.p1 TRINITY_DN1506_c0_g1~~TRINITY_DN1506_c0_g1_i1.p1  ORF type:complete len:127 (-),score=62.34 TRINITY_DN1506_c0_g1_i1:213-593(-)
MQQMRQPSPSLRPEQVIEIQLGALKNNDTPTPNSGIAQTFEFASPGNKAYTGPLTRFIQMLNNPAYIQLLNFKRSRFEPASSTGETWQITITTQDDSTCVYLWGLSKQTLPPYENCWMTDSVYRLS